MKALTARRANLSDTIADSGLRVSQELSGTGADVVQAVRAMGLEGVVAKRRSSPYEPGERSGDWVKLKLEPQIFAGKVRGGLIPHTRRELLSTLKPLAASECPFANLPSTVSSRWGGGVTADEMHEMQWTKPQLVVQVRFTEWTKEGRLRLPKFLGVRSDKAARAVVRE